MISNGIIDQCSKFAGYESNSQIGTQTNNHIDPGKLIKQMQNLINSVYQNPTMVRF